MFEINKRIREEMVRQNLTMTDLANKSGLSRSTISRYVSDSIEPKQNAVGALAKALHVSPAWLLGFDEAKTPQVNRFIDIQTLSEINRIKLVAYYEGLLDSEKGENNGNT